MPISPVLRPRRHAPHAIPCHMRKMRPAVLALTASLTNSGVVALEPRLAGACAARLPVAARLHPSSLLARRPSACSNNAHPSGACNITFPCTRHFTATASSRPSRASTSGTRPSRRAMRPRRLSALFTHVASPSGWHGFAPVIRRFHLVLMARCQTLQWGSSMRERMTCRLKTPPPAKASCLFSASVASHPARPYPWASVSTAHRLACSPLDEALSIDDRRSPARPGRKTLGDTRCATVGQWRVGQDVELHDEAVPSPARPLVRFH